MAEIEELCNRIIIIDRGEKIYDGDKKQFKDKYGYMKTIEMNITNEEKAKILDFNAILILVQKSKFKSLD